MFGYKIAEDGRGIVIGVVLFTLVLVVGAIYTPYLHLQIMAGLSLVLMGLTINFFRDPERVIQHGKGNIICPADGKVVEIREDFESEYIQENVIKVSVFMNVFDVHVNRVPITGTVGFFRYRKGSFKNAYNNSASDVNEQTIIGIESGFGKILFKQIAGLIARRIVCNLREGNNVEAGERFGMIKFGSRVDIYLPTNVELKVNLNQKVKCGKDIIGVFKDEI